jgi:hypothetical protein
MGTSGYFHYVLLKSLSYGWKHRPFEALNARLTAFPLSHPASASCNGIVTATTVTTTTPNTASADTMAITIIIVVFVVMSLSSISPHYLSFYPSMERDMRKETRKGKRREIFIYKLPCFS